MVYVAASPARKVPLDGGRLHREQTIPKNEGARPIVVEAADVHNDGVHAKTKLPSVIPLRTRVNLAQLLSLSK